MALSCLVEDSRDDAFFLRRAFLKAGLSHPMVDVRNGQQAVNYLSGKALYGDRSLYPLPGLIVVDLKMPLMDGFELLAWLQGQPELEAMPAIVISSSDLPADREKAMKLGAREYFVKPNDPADLIRLVEGLHAKWMAPKYPKTLKL